MTSLMPRSFAAILLTFGATLFVSCSGDSESENANTDQSINTETPSATAAPGKTRTAEKAEGLAAGKVVLQYGDETVEIEKFGEMGTDLLLAAETVSLSLVGTGGDKLSIGYQAKDGAPMTGEFAPLTVGAEQEKRMVQLSVMGLIGPEPGLRLSNGTVTVTQCDAEGNFVAEFSGEAVSINPTVEGSKPFSGKIDVKVPVIQR